MLRTLTKTPLFAATRRVWKEATAQYRTLFRAAETCYSLQIRNDEHPEFLEPCYQQPDNYEIYIEGEAVHAPRHDIWMARRIDSPDSIFRAKDARARDSEFNRLTMECLVPIEEVKKSRFSHLFIAQHQAWVDNLKRWLAPKISRPGPTTVALKMD